MKPSEFEGEGTRGSGEIELESARAKARFERRTETPHDVAPDIDTPPSENWLGGGVTDDNWQNIRGG